MSLAEARERASAHRSALYADADDNPVQVKRAKRIVVPRLCAEAKDRQILLLASASTSP